MSQVVGSLSLSDSVFNPNRTTQNYHHHLPTYPHTFVQENPSSFGFSYQSFKDAADTYSKAKVNSDNCAAKVFDTFVFEVLGKRLPPDLKDKGDKQYASEKDVCKVTTFTKFALYLFELKKPESVLKKGAEGEVVNPFKYRSAYWFTYLLTY